MFPTDEEYDEFLECIIPPNAVRFLDKRIPLHPLLLPDNCSEVDYGEYKSTLYFPESDRPKTIFALDCEMVFMDNDEKELGRVSLIDFQGEVVFDIFVKPTGIIKNYATRYSGLTKKIIDNAPYSLSQAQTLFIQKVRATDILVGHAIENDLRALRITHPCILDTQVCYSELGPIRGLKKLADEHLKKKVQNGQHSSVEDAIVTLELARKFVKRNKIDLTSGPQNNSSISSHMSDKDQPQDNNAIQCPKCSFTAQYQYINYWNTLNYNFHYQSMCYHLDFNQKLANWYQSMISQLQLPQQPQPPNQQQQFDQYQQPVQHQQLDQHQPPQLFNPQADLLADQQLDQQQDQPTLPSQPPSFTIKDNEANIPTGNGCSFTHPNSEQGQYNVPQYNSQPSTEIKIQNQQSALVNLVSKDEDEGEGYLSDTSTQVNEYRENLFWTQDEEKSNEEDPYDLIFNTLERDVINFLGIDV